jgi:hypothetical protein
MHRPRQRAERLQFNSLAQPKTHKAQCPLISGYAGARIRSHPALNAQVIGAIPRGASIRYVEVVKNADGSWLRLTDDVRALYCERKTAEQAWTLQYNAHLKTEHIKLAVVNGNTENEVALEPLTMSHNNASF